MIDRRSKQNGRGAVFLRSAFIVLILLISFCIPFRVSAGEVLTGVALVIGQSDYRHLTHLPNPNQDARAIGKLVDDLGFDTQIATDEGTMALKGAINSFIAKAKGADVALVYYTGHAIEAGGINYLIPTDASLSSLAAADDALVSLQGMLELLRGKARITILLLDACRSNPFPREALVRRNAGSGGAPILSAGLGAPRGAIILEDFTSGEAIGEVVGYAAEPGRAAFDGPAGRTSPYTAAILKHLSANAGYDFGQVMTMVTEEVYLSTQARQRPWTNASLRRILTFGGKVEAPSADDLLIAGERRKLLLTIAATPSETRNFVEALALEKKLPLDPLYGMLRELKVDTSMGHDDLDNQLKAGADNLKKLLADKIVPLRQDYELVRLAELADRAQSEGLIGLAKSYRAKAANRADELDKTLDQREAEVKADRLELASTYADYAGTAILAFDFKTAAEQYAKAYAQAEGNDNRSALRYRLGRADALSNHGDYKGDNDALKMAIETYQAALSQVPRDGDPGGWAKIQNDLGNAFQILGYRARDPGLLQEALAAYRAALTERTRQRLPLDWAATQSNLGNALAALGERGSGTELLEEAVTAYRAALKEQTQERVPLQWAWTQNNLGTALSMLGHRASSTARLEEAVVAHRAALQVQTRERIPLAWATTQNSLGLALWTLGGRENGTDRLEEAVDAFRLALTERTRERVPLQWASTQNNLGNVLSTLADRENGTARLEETVAAYRAALEEQTRERMPFAWATTQTNLGYALQRLAVRGSGTELLEEAVGAYRAALEEQTKERMPLQWAATQNNLGYALTLLGEQSGDLKYFETATVVLRAALAGQAEMKDNRAPLTADSLCRALLELGKAKRDRPLLLEAKSYCLSARKGEVTLQANSAVRETDQNLAKIEKALMEFQ